MERKGDGCSTPGSRSHGPTLLVWQISPIEAEQYPTPGGGMAEPCPEDPGGGGSGGKEPGKENCWKPPCSGGRRQMGGGDRWRGEGRWQRDGGCEGSGMRGEEGEKVAQRKREERIISQRHEEEQEGKLSPEHRRLQPGRRPCPPAWHQRG